MINFLHAGVLPSQLVRGRVPALPLLQLLKVSLTEELDSHICSHLQFAVMSLGEQGRESGMALQLILHLPITDPRLHRQPWKRGCRWVWRHQGIFHTFSHGSWELCLPLVWVCVTRHLAFGKYWFTTLFRTQMWTQLSKCICYYCLSRDGSQCCSLSVAYSAGCKFLKL